MGEELLRVHKSYLNLILHLKEKIQIKGLSHITGGGIIGNTKRIIPDGFSLKIDWNAWTVPALFKFIQSAGKISDEEMRKVFNIGIGLIAVVGKNDVQSAIKFSGDLKEEAIVIGEVQ